MKIELKEQDEDGSITLKGTLNAVEVNYLIQFAINGLMAMGASFMLDEEDTGENIRISFKDGQTIN